MLPDIDIREVARLARAITRKFAACHPNAGAASDPGICVMTANGTDVQRLTGNSVPDLAPVWSPDRPHLLFSRRVPAYGLQLFTINVKRQVGPRAGPPEP
jgi:Tol biopolymer transport system component